MTTGRVAGLVMYMRPGGRNFMRLLWLIALSLSFACLALSWHLPILEMHSFRQTQTAISSYWMASTAQWLAYPTPILGHPWSLPFEFPLFQGLVVLASAVLPFNLDQAGRTVSWLFAIATLWPLRCCLLEVTGRKSLADIACFLYLLSPLYLFWSRAFLIESTALFLAVSFVALVAVYLRQPRRRIAALMVVCAIAGALVKITTFFGFGLAAALLLLAHLLRSRGNRSILVLLRLYGPVVVALLVSLVATGAWVNFADAEKARTVWGWALASPNLADWTFGSWTQKVDYAGWLAVVFERAPRELLGTAWLFPVATLIALMARNANRWFAAAMLLLYAVPFVIFTNLHVVHNYYQYANGVFLVVLLACALDALDSIAVPQLKPAGVAIAGVFMIAGFYRDFLPVITPAPIDNNTLNLAAYIRSHSNEDDVMLVFGEDWSSALPYYATRRAMLVPDWVPDHALGTMRGNQQSFTGNYPLGLVVVCPNRLAIQPRTASEYALLLQAVTQGRRKNTVAGCVVYR